MSVNPRVSLTSLMSAQVIESFTYDNHYGTITNHTKTIETNNPYGYTGREFDTEELYYYRARYYDPTTQRFLGEDPIGFESADFNFYRYIHNSTITFKDPLGLKTGGMFGDIINESRDTIDPYTKYFYYYFLGQECKKLIKNYDCGCYSALECAIEIEQLRKKCKKLRFERGKKDLLDMLLP